MKELTPSDLAKLFWTAANECLIADSPDSTTDDMSSYSCNAIEVAARKLGYEIEAEPLLEPAMQKSFIYVRDLITDADGINLGEWDLQDCTPEQIEKIQGQRYMWLMFCHEAAKDGFFHMEMNGHPRNVRSRPRIYHNEAYDR